jgi:hypothetical protein
MGDEACPGVLLARAYCQTDSDLALVIDRWPNLPLAVRASIMFMLKASTGETMMR